MSSAEIQGNFQKSIWKRFERRLRVVRTPQAGVEDPLSELTRLVNTIAGERPRTEKVVDIASARMPKSEPFPNAHQLQRGTQAPSLRDGAADPASTRCAACAPRMSRRLRLRPSCRLRAS